MHCRVADAHGSRIPRRSWRRSSSASSHNSARQKLYCGRHAKCTCVPAGALCTTRASWTRFLRLAGCRHEVTCQTPGPLCGAAAVLRSRCQQSSSKFRILGLLTASASAAMPQTEENTCEFCGGDRAGQVHIAEECPIFQDLRDQPDTEKAQETHPFTRCTGIPCRTDGPYPALQWHTTHSTAWTGEAYVFTDVPASPPELPQAGLSAWSVVASKHKVGRLVNIVSGITPGQIHDICRAETFAVLQAINQLQEAAIYGDNHSVALM